MATTSNRDLARQIGLSRRRCAATRRLDEPTGFMSGLPEVLVVALCGLRRPGRVRPAERSSPRIGPRHTPGIFTAGRIPTSRAAGSMTAGLVGSERVRRHPHRRARSAPQCGVSRGPRAYRVRVPIGLRSGSPPLRPRPFPDPRSSGIRSESPGDAGRDSAAHVRYRAACKGSPWQARG